VLEPSGRLTNVVVVDLDCVDSISEEEAIAIVVMDDDE